MCLLIAVWRVAGDAPLVVAANREESYARGGTPPQLVPDPVRFLGGLDPQAGGTWFGINPRGVVVAVTNAKKTQPPAQPRSRGLLVRDLFRCQTANEAATAGACEISKEVYAGCHLFCADLLSAYVVQGGDWLRLRPLSPGVHALTTSGLNDPTDPRSAYVLGQLATRTYASAGEWLAGLKTLCGQRGDDKEAGVCVQGNEGGTVSSSVLALREPLSHSTYLHAQGPPDRTPYADFSHLFRQLA